MSASGKLYLILFVLVVLIEAQTNCKRLNGTRKEENGKNNDSRVPVDFRQEQIDEMNKNESENKHEKADEEESGASRFTEGGFIENE